jgi:hypothetical protein
MLLKKINKLLATNLSIEDKIRCSNEWIKKVGNIYRKSKEYVVFNHGIEIVIETHLWIKVFEPYKLICVYRDPRDQLADIIRNKRLLLPYGAPHMNYGGVTLESIYGRSRESAVKFHVEAIVKRMAWIDSIINEIPSERLLVVDFEGLSENYNQYTHVIQRFIGNIKQKPKLRGAYFNPEAARKNIGIYGDYLNKNDLNSLEEASQWYKRMIKENTTIQKHMPTNRPGT